MTIDPPPPPVRTNHNHHNNHNGGCRRWYRNHSIQSIAQQQRRRRLVWMLLFLFLLSREQTQLFVSAASTIPIPTNNNNNNKQSSSSFLRRGQQKPTTRRREDSSLLSSSSYPIDRILCRMTVEVTSYHPLSQHKSETEQPICIPITIEDENDENTFITEESEEELYISKKDLLSCQWLYETDDEGGHPQQQQQQQQLLQLLSHGTLYLEIRQALSIIDSYDVDGSLRLHITPHQTTVRPIHLSENGHRHRHRHRHRHLSMRYSFDTTTTTTTNDNLVVGEQPQQQQQQLALVQPTVMVLQAVTADGIKSNFDLDYIVQRLNASVVPSSSTTTIPSTFTPPASNNNNNNIGMKSQYWDCSGGQLDFIITAAYEIPLPQTLSYYNNSATLLRRDMEVAFANQYGRGGPMMFADHVIMSVPSPSSSSSSSSSSNNHHNDQDQAVENDWIAFAPVNHWRILISGDWMVSLVALMHEMGHNLGLNHAFDEQMVRYGDETGYMGGGDIRETAPQKCFNGADVHALGWYHTKETRVELLIIEEESTKTTKAATTTTILPPQVYELVAFTDFTKLTTTATTKNKKKKNKGGPPVVLLNLQDTYFILYNRQKDFNIGTEEYGDTVTITQQESYGTKFLGAMALHDDNDSDVPSTFLLNATDVFPDISNDVWKSTDQVVLKLCKRVDAAAAAAGDDDKNKNSVDSYWISIGINQDACNGNDDDDDDDNDNDVEPEEPVQLAPIIPQRCSPKGESCQASSDCCVDENEDLLSSSSSLVCLYDENKMESPVCANCRLSGQSCWLHEECCGTLRCGKQAICETNEFLLAPNDNYAGIVADANADANANAEAGEADLNLPSCKPMDAKCGNTNDCCTYGPGNDYFATLLCMRDNQKERRCLKCRRIGSPCDQDEGCCDDSICGKDGVCQAKSGGGCIDEGGPCTRSIDCCNNSYTGGGGDDGGSSWDVTNVCMMNTNFDKYCFPCRFAGQSCGKDEDCCSNWICKGDDDDSVATCSDPTAASAVDPEPSSSCLEKGELCETSEECCVTRSWDVNARLICKANNQNETRCAKCRVAGKGCYQDEDCCGDLKCGVGEEDGICYDHYVTEKNLQTCIVEDALCETSHDCCPFSSSSSSSGNNENTPLVCMDNGQSETRCAKCRLLDEVCVDDQDCCSDWECNPEGICEAPQRYMKKPPAPKGRKKKN